MPHGVDSMNDSNKKPMGRTCQPHGYVCTLVTYGILSTPWVIHNLSGPWNELVCHPRGCYLLSSPWGVSVLWVMCRTHGWHIVSAHKALTLTVFCVNSIGETNHLPMQYFNQFISIIPWVMQTYRNTLDEPVATSSMGILADDCTSIHVHVSGTCFGSDVFYFIL